MELYEQIRDRNYTPSPGVCFVVNRPVKREIFASDFRDRVVHHLLYNYISPMFEGRMIFDSYSCRRGKGTSQGIARLEHHIRSCTQNYRYSAYILKLDLRGYFMSIRKDRLYDLICKGLERYRRSRKQKECPDMELIDFLLRQIIFRNPQRDCRIRGSAEDWEGLPPTKSLFNSPEGVGLPIGDLTSQLFSNIYLGELDGYVKRVLRCKHYGRYVDDFFIVHPSKRYLKELIPWIREFLKEENRIAALQSWCGFSGSVCETVQEISVKTYRRIFSGSGTQAGKREFQRKTRSGKTAKDVGCAKLLPGAFEAFQIIRSAG